MKFIAKSVTLYELTYHGTLARVIPAIPHLAEMLNMVELREGDADNPTSMEIINVDFIDHCLRYILKQHVQLPNADIRLAPQLFMEDGELQSLVRVMFSFVQDGTPVEYCLMHGRYREVDEDAGGEALFTQLAKQITVQPEWVVLMQDQTIPLRDRQEECRRQVQAFLDVKRADLHMRYGDRYTFVVRREMDRGLVYVVILYDTKEMEFHTITRLTLPCNA